MKRPNKIFEFIFSLVAVALLASIVFIYSMGVRAVRAQREFDTATANLRLLQQILATLTDAETGQRGYLLTGNETYLQPYKEALKRFDAQAEELRAAALDWGPAATNIDTFNQLAREKLAELEQTIRLRSDAGFDAALAIVTSDHGKQEMDKIREVLAKLGEDRQRIVTDAALQAERSTSVQTIAVICTGIFGLIFVFACYRRISREIENRESAAIVVSSEDAIIGKDLSSVVTSWNKGAESIFGFTAEEMAGQSIKRIIPPERQGEEDDIISRIKRGERVEHFETVRQHKDGQLIHISVTISPIRDAGGRIIGASTVARNITKRIQAEQTLAERELQLRLFVEHSPASIAMFDREMHYLVVSHRWLADYRLNKGEVIGRSHYEVFPEIPQRWRDVHQRCLGGAVEKCDEDAFAREDGSTIWIRWEARPWTQADGTIGGVIILSENITERKLAEERARWLASFPENNPDPIIELDLAKKLIHYANPAAKKFFPDLEKYALEHPALVNLAAVVEELTENNSGLARREVVINGNTYAQAITFTAEKSRIRLYNADITERMRIQEELKASFEEIKYLKRALDEHAIVAITDPQGKITYVNDKFCAISKYSREELIGQDHRIINSGYHSKEFFHELWTTIAHGKTWHGEIKNRAKDGSYYWVDTTIAPFVNEAGKPQHYVAIRADITHRKVAEELLAHSLKEVSDFKTALDEHAIVAITDPQGKITYVNEKFCAISKYPREELVGQDHRIINSGYHPKEFFRDLWKTIAQGKVWQGEIKNKAKDGTYYWVDTTIVPFLDAHGKPRQYVAIRADITGLKNAEDVLRKQAEDLTRSNRDLEQFAYVASHDLQEPLRAVAGCLQVLQRRYQGNLDARADELIGHAVDGANRMRMLIDGLLAFSRVGTRGGEFMPTRCDEALDNALKNLSVSIQESGANITRDPLPTLPADPLQLTLLLQNLVGNAIKFRGNKPPEIHVGAERNDGYWILSVKDNGIGIDPKYFDRIFVIFQRLHTRKEYPGTGIGLSICKKIVERHGGYISVESTPGEGSIFRCSFPV